MQTLAQFGFGLALSSLIGYAGYRKKALAPSGVLGAMVVGTLIFGYGGWVWGLVLITFFILSSALSYYKGAAKKELSEKFEKGARRDFSQALANGGAGALIAVVFAYLIRDPFMVAAFTGAMATVNADTWATEIGVLSKKPPRLITTGKIVEPGTSGGISLLGTLATTAGGLIIGIAIAGFSLLDGALGGASYAQAGLATPWELLLFLPAATFGGLLGSLCDSFLGATVQAIYYSPNRKKETEKKIDADGSPNQHLRGWIWLNNDWVNFLSSIAGAAGAAILWSLLVH